MYSDEQIEYWPARMKGIAKDHSLSKEQKEFDLDDLEEQSVSDVFAEVASIVTSVYLYYQNANLHTYIKQTVFKLVT